MKGKAIPRQRGLTSKLRAKHSKGTISQLCAFEMKETAERGKKKERCVIVPSPRCHSDMCAFLPCTPLPLQDSCPWEMCVACFPSPEKEEMALEAPLNG